MTTSEYLKEALVRYNLQDFVADSNLEYNWIKFRPFTDSDLYATERFAKFLAESGVISIEPKNGSLMCHFL